MCGIAGWIRMTEQGHVPLDTLTRMNDLQAHRGPDDQQVRQWPSGGLAFRRLALVDLPGGSQPAADSHERYWSVFNGEIYNHRQLRAELLQLGLHPPGTGDAALIPYCFQAWGPAMLSRLRGMFALAVVDLHREELFLARDPFGVKPLYWSEHDGALLYSSEITPLQRAVGAQARDPQALRHYLSFGYVPDPWTLWDGIHTLPPGHYLQVRQRNLTMTRWWSADLRPSLRDRRALIDDLDTALQDSVTAHLDADVPVGGYLSSGVDSSLIVALASSQQPLDTFTVGFDGADGDRDELDAARALAQALGTRHHEQVITQDEYWKHLPMIVSAQEQPLADPSAPALWFLARQAAGHVKAVLSGEGADELFAGYPIYQEPRALAPITRLPPRVRAAIARTARGLPPGRRGRGYLGRATTPLERRFLGNVPLFSEDAVGALMNDAEGLYTAADRVSVTYADTAGHPDVARMQAVSLDTWLPASILMKADKMAMAHSLEVRVPYLDPRVYTLARDLPLRLRVNRHTTKVALRQVAARHLPAEVASRPKLGFPVPFRAWLNGPLGDRVRELFGDCDDPLLDRTQLVALLEHAERPVAQRQIWGVMTYLLWRESTSTTVVNAHMRTPTATNP